MSESEDDSGLGALLEHARTNGSKEPCGGDSCQFQHMKLQHQIEDDGAAVPMEVFNVTICLGIPQLICTTPRHHGVLLGLVE